ncbi:MAG TPA: alpha/beta hydrolase domain-containing protein [Steroidobacteraceae bacterium]|nr:alpha/beta hydrolase domain-containing protein [Steroidobacteraceae bacterium]
MQKRRCWGVGLAGACMAVVAAGSARAEVTKFEVLSFERGALEGRVFDQVGTYDRIKARVTVAVDPADPRNAVIADIGLAPKNAAGKVEAVSDVEILRPSDPKRGNGKMFYEAVNRGAKQSPGIFLDASSKALTSAADAGNGYLLRQGYTLVWSGWQGNLESEPGALALSVPTLTGVSDRITAEFVFNNTKNPAVTTLAWPAAATDDAKLVVRAKWDDPAATPRDMAFRFVDPTHVEVKRPAGFDGGAIYQLDYVARDPKVLGLGFAATRDIVAYLRHDTSAENPLADNGRSSIRRAYAYGQSQSARFLREFLYLGFNEDDARRSVFDGLLVHIAGARFTAVNMRFGLPESAPRHPQDPGAMADRFPFTYAETVNPFTRERDGLLVRCSKTRTCPKIIQADSEYEWYNSKESLLVTDPSGKPVKIPPNVRLFTMAGTPHIVRNNPLCVMPTNPLQHGPVLRAMLNNLDAWVDRNVAPPPSRIPNLADRSVLPADQAAHQLKTPIPGLPYSGMHVVAGAEDLSVHPSKLLGQFKLYLPRLDADGMMIGGVRLPAIDVPKATYTGWNPQVEGNGPTALCSLVGGVVPFASTQEEREAKHDPRPSLAERYATPAAYVDKVDQAARTLVRQRLMLEEDLPRQHEAAVNDTLAGLHPPKSSGEARATR